MVRYHCIWCNWNGEYETTQWGWHDTDCCPCCGYEVTPIIRDPEYEGEFK